MDWEAAAAEEGEQLLCSRSRTCVAEKALVGDDTSLHVALFLRWVSSLWNRFSYVFCSWWPSSCSAGFSLREMMSPIPLRTPR